MLLGNIPKITIINPIEQTPNETLINVVSSLGYKEVNFFNDVKDIMERELFENIKYHQVWRLNPLTSWELVRK